MKTVEEILQSGLIEQYVLGLSSPAEKQQLDEYIKVYPELIEYRAKMEKTMKKIALSKSIEPPTGTKNAIIKRINNLNPQTKPLNVTPKYWKYAASIFATLSIVLASLAVVHFNKIESAHQEIQSLEDRYTQLLVDCDQSTQQLERHNKMMAFAKDNDTKAVSLKGANIAPNSNGLVYWNETQNMAIISVLNLPEPPSGMTYQAWADIDGVMIDMGVIADINEDYIEIRLMKRATSINITLEKAGGSDHPDVTKLYVNGAIT